MGKIESPHPQIHTKEDNKGDIDYALLKKRKEHKRQREREYYLRTRVSRISYEADMMKLTYPSYFAYNLKLELQGEFYCKNDLIEFLGVPCWENFENKINKKFVVGSGFGYLIKTHRIMLRYVNK